jgi:hypothetical protein
MLNLKTRNIVISSKIKAFLILTLTLLFSLSTLAKIKHEERLYTPEGYPYAALLQRVDEVKLIFTEGENNVRCRVEVSLNGKIWRGVSNTAEKQEFQRKPLNSCMAREEAKQLLADTF